ncbi:FAD-dependent oxidoreductase [Nocardia sp. NPDC050713]|uniref:FAD-dependent oxidoreductase n=1 Tax=Nocardia sp. NPDC050713 TaxID=3154511 RepID=UPI00340D3D79
MSARSPRPGCARRRCASAQRCVCSVAVIGGGLAGMATALRLAEHGVDAVLLESQFCGHGSGSRNAGQLASAPGGDIQLLNLLYRKRMPAIIRLTENAAAHVEGLIDTLGAAAWIGDN